MSENANQEKEIIAGTQFHSTSAYTILEEIGRGGMGIVFLAEKDNEGVKDLVALKTLKSLSKQHEDRLRKEANIATGLRHENIVKTYGLESIPFSQLPIEFIQEIDSLSFETSGRRSQNRFSHLPAGQKQRPGAGHSPAVRASGLHGGAHGGAKANEKRLTLISMDYIEGTDLRSLHREHINRGLLIPAPIGAFVISRICRALSYAHQFIVHRDISPENIIINLQGVSKLSDFGVAAAEESDMKLFAGKLCYMSPEQIDRNIVDARSDIFSLGLVAYEIIAGFNPFSMPAGMRFEDQVTYIKNLMKSEIPPLSSVRTDVPEALSGIVGQMLRFNPELRYQNAEDVGNAFEQKYLYAEGFGPTNNGLAAYMDILEKNFQNYTQAQLKQLTFMKDKQTGKIRLARYIHPSDYTKEGMKMLAEKEWTKVFEVVAREKMKESAQ